MSLNLPATRVCKGLPYQAEMWRNDVTVKYTAGDNLAPIRGDRKDITILTKRSLQRMCFVAQNTEVTFKMLTTLTYPKVWKTDGKEVKKDFYKWLKWARRKCGLTSYFWCLEFQGRGAPHFHIFTPINNLAHMKLECSAKWYEIVGSEDEKHLGAGTRVERLRKPDAVGRYAAKYAAKTHQKAVPPDYRNVGRFWGNSYDVNPRPLAGRALAGWGDLIDQMVGWEYIERLERRKPMAVLYNAGKYLIENLDYENSEGEQNVE